MSITQSRLAKAIGVDARRINSIVRGERAVTAETALLLASFFGNSPCVLHVGVWQCRWGWLQISLPIPLLGGFGFQSECLPTGCRPGVVA